VKTKLDNNSETMCQFPKYVPIPKTKFTDILEASLLQIHVYLDKLKMCSL